MHPEVSFTAVQLEDVIQSAFMSTGSASKSTVEKKEKSEKSGPLNTDLNWITFSKEGTNLQAWITPVAGCY